MVSCRGLCTPPGNGAFPLFPDSGTEAPPGTAMAILCQPTAKVPSWEAKGMHGCLQRHTKHKEGRVGQNVLCFFMPAAPWLQPCPLCPHLLTVPFRGLLWITIGCNRHPVGLTALAGRGNYIGQGRLCCIHNHLQSQTGKMNASHCEKPWAWWNIMQLYMFIFKIMVFK